MTTMRLGDILVSNGFVTAEALNASMRNKAQGVMLGDWLIQQSVITRKQLGQALARQFDVPYAEIDVATQNPQIVRLIPEPFARSRVVVAIRVERRTLHVAMVAPDDIETIAEIELMTGYHVEPYIAQECNVLQAIDRGYDDRSIARQTVVDMKFEELTRIGVLADDEEFAPIEQEEEDAPVVRLVKAILTGAIDAGASDIHLEPHQPEMRVRYRVDGELQQVMTIPTHIEQSVVSRIKVMADMNTTETRRAQDGHLSLNEKGKKVNYRVSGIPTVSGEKMVLRLLDEGSKIFDLKKLGIEPQDLKLLQAVVDFIQDKMMPIVKRYAVSGRAMINTEEPLFRDPTAIAILIDIYSERGFRANVDIHRVEIPDRFDLVTGQIETREKRVFRISVLFAGSKIRRG